jgi:hypothetical protein
MPSDKGIRQEKLPSENCTEKSFPFLAESEEVSVSQPKT